MVTIETNFFLTDEKKRSTLIIDKPFEPIEINKALIEDNLIKELEETTSPTGRPGWWPWPGTGSTSW